MEQLGTSGIDQVAPPSLNMELLGHIGGWTNAVAFGIDRAYVGVGRRFAVLDISDLRHPRLLGFSSLLTGVIADLTEKDGRLYVVSGNMLMVYDATVPQPVAPIGSMTFVQTLKGVAVDERYVYLTLAGIGMAVIDFSNPSAPIQVGAIDPDGNAGIGVTLDVAIAGDLAILADDAQGVRIVDISDPGRPLLKSSFDKARGMQGKALAVVVEGAVAYIAAEGGGLEVLDISNPVSPRLLATVPMTVGRAVDIAIDETRVYVCNWVDSDSRNGGIVIFDRRNLKLAPRKAYIQGLPMKLAVRDGVAYVAAMNGWRVADLNDPRTIANSKPDAPVETDAMRLPSGGLDLDLEGSRLYVADHDAGLAIVDVSDPRQMQQLGYLAGLDETWSVDAVGDNVYVGARDRGLARIDASTPQAPMLSSQTVVRGYPSSVTLGAGVAYVTYGNDGIRVFQINGAGRVGSYSTIAVRSSAEDFAVDGDRGFSVEVSSGVRAWDLSQPGRPLEVGRFDLSASNWASGITVVGPTAYVAGANPFLKVFDVTDLKQIRLLGSTSIGGLGRRVAVDDGIAYVAGEDRVTAIDVSLASAPKVVGYYTVGKASDVVLKDGIVLVNGNGTGIFALRYVPPPTPTGTPTATLSPTATKAITPTPTRTVTSEPSATNLPSPTLKVYPSVFLPMLLRDQGCPPQGIFTDVALVIDASTSMDESAGPGRPRKIDVAADAAWSFVDRYLVTDRADQVGVVLFNMKAAQRQVLTRDRGRLAEALSVPKSYLRKGSQIHLGIAEAATMLVDPRFSDRSHRKAMLLVSDGLVNPGGPGDVLRAAEQARAQGIAIYVVGYGESLDDALLGAIASPADQRSPTYFRSPLDADLQSLVSRLSLVVPCPADLYWPRRDFGRILAPTRFGGSKELGVTR